jgi:hypothetical protein
MVFSGASPTFGQFTGTVNTTSIPVKARHPANTDSLHECPCMQQITNTVGKSNNQGHQELLNHELVNKNKMVVDTGYRHAGIFIGDQSVHSIAS